MVDYNSFVLEGIKILFNDNKNELFNDICDPLINILCIKNYYYSTGIYKYDDANEQKELLKKAILSYRMAH